MAKISIETVREETEKNGWKLLSEEYINLKTEMSFECSEGHKIYASWEKTRNKFSCPVCKTNRFIKMENSIKPKKKGVHRVLALDQATKITGFSIFDDQKLIYYGTFKTMLNDEIARDSAIKTWLLSMLDNWKPDIVGVEGLQYEENHGVTVFETLARLQGILLETLFWEKIPYKICPTNTWRHHCGVKGRSLPNDMEIPTTNGVKKVGEIKKGDFLFDRLGRPTKVLEIFPQGELPVWNITFADGRTIECSEDHLWSYHTLRQREEAWNNNKFKTSTTKELSQKSIYSGNSKSYNLLVPYCSPVNYPNQPLEIPPYVLGVFLGDGSFRLGKENSRPLQLSSKNNILPDKIATLMNWEVRHSSGYTYYFYNPSLKKNVQVINFLQNFPKLINTNSKSKFIPEEYMVGSIEQRIELLQGLLDTDGSASEGRVRFSTISEKLAGQVQQLAFSLGLSASLTKQPPHGFGKEENYIVHIFGNPEIKTKLFTLDYKKRQANESTNRKYKTNAIIKVEKTDKKKTMTCFLVDNKENLFLAKDYIVTHNSRVDKKRSMQKIVKEAFDVSVTDDEADAIGIGKFVSETTCPQLKIESWE